MGGGKQPLGGRGPGRTQAIEAARVWHPWSAAHMVGMNKSLVSLLQSHVPLDDSYDGVPEGHIRCNWVPCDFQPIREDVDHQWRRRFAEHVAEKLITGGFIQAAATPTSPATS